MILILEPALQSTHPQREIVRFQHILFSNLLPEETSQAGNSVCRTTEEGTES